VEEQSQTDTAVARPLGRKPPHSTCLDQLAVLGTSLHHPRLGSCGRPRDLLRPTHASGCKGGAQQEADLRRSPRCPPIWIPNLSHLLTVGGGMFESGVINAADHHQQTIEAAEVAKQRQLRRTILGLPLSDAFTACHLARREPASAPARPNVKLHSTLCMALGHATALRPDRGVGFTGDRPTRPTGLGKTAREILSAQQPVSADDGRNNDRPFLDLPRRLRPHVWFGLRELRRGAFVGWPEIQSSRHHVGQAGITVGGRGDGGSKAV
jgi:hypothetical protein